MFNIRQAVRRSWPKGEFRSHPFSTLIQHPSKTDARGLSEPQGMNKGYSLSNLLGDGEDIEIFTSFLQFKASLLQYTEL